MLNTSSSNNHDQDQSQLSGPTRIKMGKSEDNDKKVTFVFIQIRLKSQNNAFYNHTLFLECIKFAALFKFEALIWYKPMTLQ